MIRAGLLFRIDMKKFIVSSVNRKLLADTYTPVSVYARMREYFPVTFLLESSDYRAIENSLSFICAEPIASIEVTNDLLRLLINKEPVYSKELRSVKSVPEEIDTLLASFSEKEKLSDIPYNGFFGYANYDAVNLFNPSLRLTSPNELPGDVPVIQYHLFRYVLVFNHFTEQLYLFENTLHGEPSELNFIEGLLRNKNFRPYPFSVEKEESSNLTEDAFLRNVIKGKEHCQRGDVFQIVLSKRFSLPFKGDDFNVYRTLRSINPSPYLFYFDFGSFRIFGSSPEAQLIIQNGKAYINPIAGTFKRTGNDEQDKALAEKLLNDPKENAEHVMLVDLARNDLSVHCKNVKLEKYKDIQFYSHVIHLVSTVSGEMIEPDKPFRIFSSTFPAGTLSGAPKYKAMQLIDSYEGRSRGWYGGAIGIIGINGNMNQAIMIRSFFSKNSVLYYQAGAGVVIDSVPQSELQEVKNKLGALKKAISEATTIKA